MYGSIEGVKDNLPRFAESIKPDAQATGRTDIKESTVINYLEEFSSQVDAALSGEYVLPFTGGTPPVVDSIVNSLAAYKLARRFWTVIGNEENVMISSLRKDAKELLESIETGSYILVGAERIYKGGNEVDLFLQQRRDTEEIFTMEDPVLWQDKL